MNLDEGQIAKVREWIDQGLKVAEIQTRLAEQCGVRLTYMEARLLLDDLKLKPRDLPGRDKSADAVLGGAAPAGQPSGAGLAGTKEGPAGAPGGNGRVSVSVDDIARPNALVSGKVTFRDGQAADWQIDQMGRLAVMPKQQGYKPSQADVMDFQMELESILARLGY
jgi:hypothetical protein